MGGSGSTRWGGHSKRWTAEDCLRLSIFDIRRLLGATVFSARKAHQGIWLWTRRDGSVRSSVGYSLQWMPAPFMALRYTPKNATEEYLCPIGLQATPCHYGKERWWFTCPACQQRVAVLFYREAWWIHAVDWACRRCHDLTYTSAQEAHLLDRGGSPYSAYIPALSGLMKAQDILKKHPRGRKAQKAQRIYNETKLLLDRLKNAARAETTRRNAAIIAALEADKSRSR